MTSRVRQNFHADSEAAINKQINMELYASYAYLALGFYFDRDDVALKKTSEYFLEMSKEENEHARGFMKYMNKRGGKIVLQPIEKPDKEEWGSLLEAYEWALALERRVNESLLEMHKIATSHDDAQMCDFIEENYLEEQVNSIKELADRCTNLERVGRGLGEYLFDKHGISD